MSETAKVRLVRCPKCENLLPEVTDFSVYQCGGCGAVLRGNSLCASVCVCVCVCPSCLYHAVHAFKEFVDLDWI